MRNKRPAPVVALSPIAALVGAVAAAAVVVALVAAAPVTALPKPPAGSIGLHFTGSGRGYVWNADHVFETADDCATWNEIYTSQSLELIRDHSEPRVDGKGGLWIPEKSRLVHLTAHRTAESLELPAELELRKLDIGADGSVWIIGDVNKGREVLLYRSTDLKHFDRVAEWPGYFVMALKVTEKNVFITVSDTRHPPPEDFLLRGRNLGKSWAKEIPANPGTLDPIFFENDDVVWAYATMDRIQRRGP